MASTQPLDAEPAPSVIQWYFGPTPWDTRSTAMWHALCPDPYNTGHDGEVWLDHHQGAFCTGCRHYEPGQEEQEAPADIVAATDPGKPWEALSPENPTPEAVASANEAMRAAAEQTTTEAPPVPAPPAVGDAASNALPTDGGAAAAASNAAAALTPEPVPERTGILGRIEQALGGGRDASS